MVEQYKDEMSSQATSVKPENTKTEKTQGDQALVEDLLADVSDEQLADIFGGEDLGKIEAALVQRL